MSGGHDDDDELHEEHEEHGNHEAWVIPYADLLTLLMAMFIALFAISSVNVDKAKRLEQGFNNAASTPLAGIFDNGASKTAVPASATATASQSGPGILGGRREEHPRDDAHPNTISPSSAIQAAEKKEQKRSRRISGSSSRPRTRAVWATRSASSSRAAASWCAS